MRPRNCNDLFRRSAIFKIVSGFWDSRMHASYPKYFNCVFFSRSKELQSNPASQHLIERRTANYGAPSAPDSNTVDLHNKEFCVDVSTYLPVEWKEVEAEQCDTAFVKQCEDREEDVCAEVTETRCQVRTWLGVKYKEIRSKLSIDATGTVKKTASHINIRLPLTCSVFFLSKILISEHLSSFFKQPKTYQ